MAEATPSRQDNAIGKALFFIGMATFASIATMRVADPLLPQIAQDFDVTVGEAAIVSSSFTIAYAFGQFIYGPLGDRFGKLRIIAGMTILSALTVSAASLAGSLQELGVARFLAGSTTAAIVPLAMAFIGDHVDYEHRQAVLARFLSGTVLGVILGQAFGGMIGDWLGWRAVFPPLGVILLLMGLLLLWQVRHGRLPPPKLGSSLSLTSILEGYRALLRRRWARIIIAAVFIEGVFFYGAFTFIGADLHQRFDISYSNVGLILCFFGMGGLAYIMLVHLLVRKLGERGISISGGTLIAAGLIAVMTLPLILLPFGLFILGLGLYMLHNTLQTNATQMAPEARGLAVSTFANSLFLGQAAGVYMGGLIVDGIGFPTAYATAALGLFLLGITLSQMIRRRSDTR